MKPLWSSFLIMILASFGLNWVWEMIQMPAYREMAGRPWSDTLELCTIATLGDVLLTVLVYGVGALAAGDVRWGMPGKWNVYAAAALLGAAVASVVEWRALAAGRWSYSDRMPIMPFLEVGLWPFLQLTLLVPAAVWIAAWWSDGASQDVLGVRCCKQPQTVEDDQQRCPHVRSDCRP